MAGALEEVPARGQRFSQTASIPAPVKGWNNIDPLAAMDPQFAVQLDNWIPQPGYIQARSGSANWATGLAAPAWSLIPYVGGSVRKLFAASGTGLFDVTNSGAVGASAYTIAQPKNWVSQAFATTANVYTMAVNGVDPAAFYDGAAWTAAAITGVSPSVLASVTSYQGRLWFTQKNSLQAWYLAPGAIQGAATLFDLGPIAFFGGRLISVSTWSPDAGAGPNNYLVFLTDQGECIVYQGTDPSQTSSFGLVGRYRIPKPIGVRCTLPFASDLLVLTQQGVYPLTKALLSSSVNRASAITYSISNQFAADYAAHGATDGWELTLLSEANLLIVNVPGADPSTGDAAQYVMNTLTGAWCRFLGLAANCFVDFGGSLFFGGQTAVVEGLVGTDDLGSPIVATVLTAYNYFDQQLANKAIRLVRPTLTTSGDVSLFIGLAFDFQGVLSYSEVFFAVTQTGLSGIWDLSLWDQATWQPDTFSPLQWVTPDGELGFAIAIGIQTQTAVAILQIASFDVLFELSQGVL